MADSKISALSTVSEPSYNDLLAIVADMATTPVTKSVTAANLLDGWIMAPTWTYASASTFTVAGDYTGVYIKGTRLRWTQTTVKYGVVVSSSYSAPNTTVTIVVNTDYTIANAAITAQAYSYQSCPINWPGWFNFDPAPVGWSGSPPTAVVYRYNIVGSIVKVLIRQLTGTTSTTTGVSFTAPVTAATITNAGWGSLTFSADDNSATITTPGRVSIPTASATITCFKDMASGAWTASGTKRVNFLLDYEF